MKELIEQELLPILEKSVATGKWKVYEEYKDSGVEWLGKVPEHWKTRRIKYLASLQTRKFFEKPEDLPYIGLEHIESETGKLIQTTVIENVESAMSFFPKDSVLFGKLRPYLAKVLFVDFEGVCTTELLVFRPCNYLYGKYLYYRLISNDFINLVTSSTYGTKMPRASSEQICNIPMQFPPYSEQKTIVAFLDRETIKINDLIAKKERMIELLQERRTAIINRAITKGLNPDVAMKDSGVEWLGEIPEHWEVRKIKRLCLVKRGASPRPIDDPIYFDDTGDYSWVRISDVTASKKFLQSTEQRLSLLGASKSVKLEPGEIFLSIAGSVGKAIITQIRCCIHDGFVYFVHLKENRDFLFYIFSQGKIYEGLGKLGTQLNLNTDTIGNIYVPIPPKKEQESVAIYIEQETEKIDKLISVIEEGIKKLKEYGTALVSAAVTGKIDVRGEVADVLAEETAL